MVEILGKRSRKVPVLLTPDTKEAIELLNKTRSQANVFHENKFVFAINNGKSPNYIRGSDALNKASKMIPLQKPALLTSTKLRKYCATISQLVDMNETELGWLAKHLGHNISIHRDFYRLQESTLEMAVVGNLLEAVDNGETNRFRGKDLRDITLQGKSACAMPCK